MKLSYTCRPDFESAQRCSDGRRLNDASTNWKFYCFMSAWVPPRIARNHIVLSRRFPVRGTFVIPSSLCQLLSYLVESTTKGFIKPQIAGFSMQSTRLMAEHVLPKFVHPEFHKKEVRYVLVCCMSRGESSFLMVYEPNALRSIEVAAKFGENPITVWLSVACRYVTWFSHKTYKAEIV